MTINKMHFETYEAFINQVEKPAHPKNDLNSSRRDRDASWCGTKSFAETMRLLRLGWPEGTAKLQKELAGTELTITRLEPAFDVTGLVFDLDRVLTGEPEDMLYFLNTPDGSAKFVTVYVQLNYSASNEGSAVVKRGARILSKIQQLELEGTRVEIVGYFRANDGNGNTKEHTINLKHFEHGLEIDRMAFAMINPSMLRRAGFSLTEQIHPDDFYSTAYGYSRPLPSVPAGAVHVTCDDFSAGSIDQCFTLENPA